MTSERRFASPPILMIPGPVTVEQEVLHEMGAPLVPHYGLEWVQFYRETIELLRTIHHTTGKVFLLVGAGSAGLDAAIGTAMAVSDRILVLKNGFFGDRIEEIARTRSESVASLSFPWGTPVLAEVVDDELARTPTDAVVVAHCETSTGVLNPVDQLAKVCREHDALLLVDAISSLGIEPLFMDEWGVDVCISASQKGLGAPPGLATVAVSKRAWQRLASAEPHGWYLNLVVWDRYEREWGDWHPHPVTHAVSNVRALNVGLRGILNEGIERRWTRHEVAAKRLRGSLQELGLAPSIEGEFFSHGVTAASVESVDAFRLLEVVRTEYQTLLAGGLGAWKGKVIRIGHMGLGATEQSVSHVIDAIGGAIASLAMPTRRQ